MIDRIVHLGFEVRVELTLADESPLIAQLTRAQVEELELAERPDRLRDRGPRAALRRERRQPADRGARPRLSGGRRTMSLAAVVATAMFAILIAFVGMVLWATLRQIDGEAAAPPSATALARPARPGPGRSASRAGRDASGCSASVAIGSGSVPATTSASVTDSSTWRMFARSASQTSRSGCDAAAVLDLVGGLAAHGRQRPLDRADHLGQRDVVGAAREPVAAVGAAPAVHQPVDAQLAEDVLEEAQRDRLRAARAPRPSPAAPRTLRSAASSTIARTA